MGFAKYHEDNNFIVQERLENRLENRAEKENSSWRREANRVRDLCSRTKNVPLKDELRSSQSEEERRARVRVKELISIKESLFYKINLSLSVANSVSDSTIQCVAKALSIEQEDSYFKISTIIQSIDGVESNYDRVIVDVEAIKKSLVRVIFYKTVNIINNAKNISFDEMESIKNDLLVLIFWFYCEDTKIGRLILKRADCKMAKQFIRDEIKTDFCSCPICGCDTVYGLKYCIECAREWK